MSDATNPPLSEEQERQYREYLDQLRSAPAEQVLTEVLSGLLSAAQAKLGRRDARLLIDVTAIVIDHVRRHLSPELARQLEQLLGQLRLGQVQAEQAQAQAGTGQPEPNDLAEVPAPPAGAAGEPPAAEPTGQPSTAAGAPRPEPPPASRLWVPGR